MSFVREQEKEIATIRPKKITLELSEADCERISKLCGEHNLTVGELLKNFIGDLVDGTYSNGSDERMYAREWFDRCWFGAFPEKTLLNYLLTNWEMSVEDFLGLLDNLNTAYADYEEYKKNPTDFNEEEVEYIKEDIEDSEKELSELKESFLKYCKDESPVPDWEQEVEKVKAWAEEMERMKAE